MLHFRPDNLKILAWANVALHVLALILAAIGMRPGTPLMPLADRLDYLARRPAGWLLGWAAWMACAVLLIAFLAVVVERLGPNGGLARLGLVIAIVGAGFDLLCDSIYMMVLPMIAAWEPPPEQLFLTVEKATGIASLFVANGAYSVAILLVSGGLGQRGIYSGTVRLGYAVGVCGLVLAAAAFTGSAEHAMLATLPTIGLFCFWVLVVARDLEPGRSVP
jgi:hypothetical protein